MVDSPSVLTSSIKQPLLEKVALESSPPSSHQTRADMRRQYKRRVEKSRLAAAASSSQNGNFLSTTSDAEDRQGVIDCDTSLLVASTSETDSITNIPTLITSGFTSLTTSTKQERTRSQSLQSQSIDEQIMIPTAKSFPLSNKSINKHALKQSPPQQPQQQSIESPTLPPKPPSVYSSPKPQSDDLHRKDPSWEDRRATIRTPPPSLPPSRDRTNIINLSPRLSNPKCRRSSTYESAASSTVVDDALMDRALYIRENLRKYEMLELAAEAERAAESGMEKFVGSASKYVEESPDQTPIYSEQRKQFADPFTPSMTTPQRSRGLLELDPLEFTPSSYFGSSNNTKKIKVSALRKFSDVVPNFIDMHSNIRFHLQRSGVDVNTLPENDSRMSLVKNDTIDSDALSQAPSLGSFSTYAASSIKSSLTKGVVDLLGRSRSNRSNKNTVPGDFSIVHKSSSAMSTLEGEKSVLEEEKSIKPLWEPAEEEERIVDKSASADFIKAKRPPLLFPTSVQMTRSADLGGDRDINTRRRIPPLLTSKSETKVLATESDDDSDDSSVEVYGRKSTSPLNTSLTEENEINQNEVKPTLTRSRSVQAFPSFENSYRGSSSNKVSFEDPLGQSLGCRSCIDGESNNVSSPEVPFLQKKQTRGSVDETGTVLSLFDKLQQRFSASIDEFRGDDSRRNPFTKLKSAKENKMFLSNYFYTEKDGKARGDDVANLKIDISQPRKDSEAFCIGYCAEDDTKLVNSCESLGKFVTSAFEWVYTKKSDSAAFSGRSESAPAFSNLYNTDTGHDREKRVFAPPRLSERCVMNMTFASVDDLRQPKHRNEGNLDCSEIVVCDGCSPNKAFDTNMG